MMRQNKTAILLLWSFLMLAAVPAWAAESILLGINQSLPVQVGGISRVAVANPEIADVVVISEQELLVVAKQAGSTSLYVWRGDGRRLDYQIVVDGNDAAAGERIRQLLDYPDVRISKVGNKIVVEGTVENQYEKNKAEKVALLYGEQVVNLLEMNHPKQVKIEAKVIEIATDNVKKLGLQFANASDIDKETGKITIGEEGIFGVGQSFGNSEDGSRVFHWFGSYADINARVQALAKNGDAKILSQPSIVTMSGEKANILIGGEIPIPVSADDDRVTVEWREYGIKLNIEPVVNNSDDIQSKIQAEVSNIDYASAISVSSGGISVPPLRTRKAEAVVHMVSGTTMAIGGLISSDDSKQISKIPLLGDLPIIGHFFRNTATTKERKEIVILITPTIVSSDYLPKLSVDAKALAEREEGNDDAAKQ